jgi:hypothetical protein
VEELVWQSGEGADLKRLAERDDLLNVVNLCPTGNELIRATFQANRVPPSMRRSAARHERVRSARAVSGVQHRALENTEPDRENGPEIAFFCAISIRKNSALLKLSAACG